MNPLRKGLTNPIKQRDDERERKRKRFLRENADRLSLGKEIRHGSEHVPERARRILQPWEPR